MKKRIPWSNLFHHSRELFRDSTAALCNRWCAKKPPTNAQQVFSDCTWNAVRRQRHWMSVSMSFGLNNWSSRVFVSDNELISMESFIRINCYVVGSVAQTVADCQPWPQSLHESFCEIPKLVLVWCLHLIRSWLPGCQRQPTVSSSQCFTTFSNLHF